MTITAYKQDIGQVYNNPFKDNNIYPFNKIGRVVVDKDTAEIKYWLNDSNSNLSQSGYPINIQNNEDIMVYFPAFYAKRKWSGDVLEDSILTDIPTTQYRQDYEVFPCFVREDGSIRPYVLYGAFKGSVDGGQLRSIIGKKPHHTATIGQFRDLSRQGRDIRWNIETFGLVSMVQFLYKVGFQNLNSQAILGNGWTSKTESALTGSTMLLGNRSGYLNTNGEQISLFGIEDFYGNVWSFVDGFYVKDDGYYLTEHPNKMGVLLEHDFVPSSPLMGVEPNAFMEGYFKSIENIQGKYKFINLPNKLGGNTNISYCDYFISHRKSQINIHIFGADWGYGSRSGAFCLSLSNSSSYASVYVGGRLCFLP